MQDSRISLEPEVISGRPQNRAMAAVIPEGSPKSAIFPIAGPFAFVPVSIMAAAVFPRIS
jgi:hypothetical protein